ncbi:hypothetical protein H0H81_001067 [Sphagnurus paluster]|uniref:Uncharacterized protein n=1 Tax=Sphagnurus paluster TaxID=117069 RepID=A0A9P7GMD5_9AGAR|nr:hypothetical protein H0H81_001067 [Sphagnurus paluster]
MDTNWCLACDCHFVCFPYFLSSSSPPNHFPQEGPGPYCSPLCQDNSGPSNFLERYSEVDYDDDFDDIIYHQVDDVHTNSRDAGILAWAAAIPPASGCDYPARSRPTTPSKPPTPSTSRLPKLLRPNQRPAPPALCVTAPRAAPASPTRPMVTPKQHFAFASRTSLGADSTDNSVLSGPTDSSIATPASTLAIAIPSSSFLGALATHVRSWVAGPPTPLIASPTSPKLAFHQTTPSTAKPNPAHLLNLCPPDLSCSYFENTFLPRTRAS